jgi:cysteinyl-tRNA synthetase
MPAGIPAAFAAAMDDDLGVPQALGVLHETVRAANTALDAGDLAAGLEAARAVIAMTEVLGLDEPEAGEGDGAEGMASALDSLVQTLIGQRAQARADKDWAAADRIRDAVAGAGITLEDTPDGTHWSIDG